MTPDINLHLFWTTVRLKVREETSFNVGMPFKVSPNRDSSFNHRAWERTIAFEQPSLRMNRKQIAR
jgi:hypothetical protein